MLWSSNQETLDGKGMKDQNAREFKRNVAQLFSPYFIRSQYPLSAWLYKTFSLIKVSDPLRAMIIVLKQETYSLVVWMENEKIDKEEEN